MRFLIGSLLCLFLTVSISAQDKIDERVISEGQSLLEDIKSMRAYKRFVAHYKTMGKGDLQEKMTAIGILGWKTD